MTPKFPSIRATMSLFQYQNSHYISKIILKYTPKQINCNTFFKISSSAKYPAQQLVCIAERLVFLYKK